LLLIWEVLAKDNSSGGGFQCILNMDCQTEKSTSALCPSVSKAIIVNLPFGNTVAKSVFFFMESKRLRSEKAVKQLFFYSSLLGKPFLRLQRFLRWIRFPFTHLTELYQKPVEKPCQTMAASFAITVRYAHNCQQNHEVQPRILIINYATQVVSKGTKSPLVMFHFRYIVYRKSLNLSSKQQNASTPPKGRSLSGKETKVQLINRMSRNVVIYPEKMPSRDNQSLRSLYLTSIKWHYSEAPM